MATKLQRLIASTVPVAKASLEAIFLRNLKLVGVDEQVMDSPYTKSQLVHVCISRTARAVSQVPLIKYQVDDNGIAEPVSPSDPWQRLLLYPNPLMNTFSFIETIVSLYMLDGFVAVIPFPPGAKVPAALYVVPKACMEPFTDPETGQLSGWVYRPSGAPGAGSKGIPLEARHVIRFATFSPNDPIMGQAPSEAGGMAIRTDYKAEAFNEQFFDNAAVPAGAITSPERSVMGKKQWDRLREQLEGRHVGYRKAHKLLYLERGLKFEQMSVAHKDMMFPDLKRMSREQIMQIYGTPKAALSVTEDLNYATAKEQKKGWWEDTLISICKMLAFGFTHNLLGQEQSLALSRSWQWEESSCRGLRVIPKGRFIEGFGKTYIGFDLTNVPALREDLADKILSAQRLGRLGFTPNEINQRLELGFDEKTWRDYWWNEPSQVCIGEDWDPELSKPQPKPEPPPLEDEDTEDEEIPEEEEPGGSPEPEEVPEEELPPEEVEEEELGPIGKSEEGLGLEEWEADAEKSWTSFVNSSTVLEEQFQKKVSRIFWEMRRRSLRHLLDNYDIQGLLMEQFEEEMRELSKWSGRLYHDSVRLGLLRGREEVLAAEAKLDLPEEEPSQEVDSKAITKEPDPDLMELITQIDLEMAVDPDVLAFIQERRQKIKGLKDAVAKDVRVRLSEGAALGESIPQLADRIKTTFKNATSRAKTIARTEVISASNYGRNKALRNSGFQLKRWYTALDERVRSSHKLMLDRDPIPIDDSWKVTSVDKKHLGMTYTLKYPGDFGAQAPHETINCRCIEVIVSESHAAIAPDPKKGGATGGGIGIEDTDLASKQFLDEMEAIDKPSLLMGKASKFAKDQLGIVIDKGTFGRELVCEDYIKWMGQRGGVVDWKKVDELYAQRLRFFGKELATLNSNQRMRAVVKKSPVKKLGLFTSQQYRDEWHDSVAADGYWHYMEPTTINMNVSQISPLFKVDNFDSVGSKRVNEGYFADIFIHETGHAINHSMTAKAKTLAKKKEFYSGSWTVDYDKAPIAPGTDTPMLMRAPYKKDVGYDHFVSEYAQTNPSEDFAESLMTWVKIGEDGWAQKTTKMVGSVTKYNGSDGVRLAERLKKKFDAIDEIAKGMIK